MADNVTLDIMSGGDTIGADDIAGVKYQRMKMILGANGTNDGDVAASNPLPVQEQSTDTKPIFNKFTTIADGSKVTVSAGTAVALATSTACKRIQIQAKFNNTGIVVVGASTVVAAESTRRGIALNPGDAIELDIDNVNDVYIDSTVSGEGVTFTYFS